MSNIIKIIASDIKRLSINVVAIVVIIGLSVIPSLYAWFNILSNWDPYGPDATANLQVAVASSDEGMVIGGAELNVGEKIVSNLKENSTIGWVFTDTAAQAIDGVYAGDYYAALIIDEKFTANMVSFLGGDIENPKITYYENDKKNAIAPKITNKVKNTVKKEIDETFVSTLASVILEASDYLVSVDENGKLTGVALTKLENLDSDMTAVILILDSYIALMDSTENLMVAGEAVSDQVDALMESAEAMADSAQVASESTKTLLDTTTVILVNTLRDVSAGLDILYAKVQGLINSAQTGGIIIEGINNDVVEKYAKEDYGKWYTYKNKAENATVISSNPEKVKNIDDAYIALLGKDFIDDYAVNSNVNYPLTQGHLYDLEKAASALSEDTTAVGEAVKKDIQTCQTNIDQLVTEYNTSVQPAVQNSLDKVGKSLTEIEGLLKYKTNSINAVAKTLGSYPDMMSNSKESLVEARKEAAEMEEQLSTLIDEMKGLEENDQYKRVVDLLQNDPEYLADFISSPVDLSEEYIYEVTTNGSATAPFYIVLSIWVGSLIMSTILKTNVKNKNELVDVKNWQCFIGRYFITWIVGQIQTIITVMGALLYVGIQCLHPFLFWLACSWTSTVFSLLLYSFTYSFGNIGEALSVILMVIQVAGAGGTFPIEVLPKVFQFLYKFMPFNYAMNALRECVGGFYKHNYWIYLLILLIYVVIACINGILLYYPCKRLNDQIEKSKEKSGILI